MKTLKIICYNLLTAFIFWLGFVQGVAGVRNIALTFIWGVFVLLSITLITLLIVDIPESKKTDKYPNIPWLTKVVAVAIIICLAWYGYTASAVAYSLTWVFLFVHKSLLTTEKAAK